MTKEIMQIGKRKFVIWLVGSVQLGILAAVHNADGVALISDLVYRDCFIGLTAAVVVGYAAEYFGKK